MAYTGNACNALVSGAELHGFGEQEQRMAPHDQCNTTGRIKHVQQLNSLIPLSFKTPILTHNPAA